MIAPSSSLNKVSSIVKMSKEDFLHYYHQMLLIRRFEEKAGQLYGMGLIAGFCHLYIGQEAVVVGIQSVLSDHDTVISAYREHGHMLACGMDAKGVMAELTGREGGYSKGKGGSMHMFSREKNFFGGHGIVGAQVPIGAGLAFAHKYHGNDGVCVTYMGDGATDQGQVYEAFNMSSLWKLPALFVIENNGYSMGTAVHRHASGKHLYERGAGYGIPGREVNGMDMLEVQTAAREALDYVRSGKGPFILEMKTYRYRGHSMSDPANYRSKDEVDHMRDTADPILRMRHKLEQEFQMSEEEFKKIDRDVKAVVAEAVEFAQTSPEPAPSELFTDILIEDPLLN